MDKIRVMGVSSYDKKINYRIECKIDVMGVFVHDTNTNYEGKVSFY